MRKVVPMLISVLLTLTFLIGVAEKPAQPRNIILIGWDGVQRAHLKELLNRNELPNLSSLIKEGALVDIDITSGATDTKAGWVQILTGYSPEKTGVYSNSRYQPIPEGYTVFERLEEFFGPENIWTGAVIGKKGNVDNDPPRRIPYQRWLRQQKRAKELGRRSSGLQGGKIVEENGRKFVEIPGKPWFNASKKMDLFVNGLGVNANVGRRALEELEKHYKERFFLFIHFADPDSAGHKYGENSLEYEDAIKSCDRWLGEIMNKLKKLGIYDNTLIYVTADHGFDEGKTTHSYAPYVFLATNDKEVRRNGDRTDIAPTILKRFGIDVHSIQPALDGIPLDEPAPERKAPPQSPKVPKVRQKAVRSKI
ncbi:alkaline phosphatase family protein [bacterium]|nr:alkaline phosphatase family protein [bacterium]